MGSQNSDDHISVFGAISLYRYLLSVGRIKENGAAHKRLGVLEKRYKNGDKYFAKVNK
jgi:hypothetical protein|tara:strand:+ start:6128 stop:6301 length:174 start_codon:yes stop_codon:yes gene_type:complete